MTLRSTSTGSRQERTLATCSLTETRRHRYTSAMTASGMLRGPFAFEHGGEVRVGVWWKRDDARNRRAVPTESNDHSVALWVLVSTDQILLGADLEETADPRAGWPAVIRSNNRPQGRASVYKVPHHGSKNGHNPLVWSEMLSGDPHAILTPWNRSKKLPAADDLVRLRGLSNNVHLTAPPADLARVPHDHEVERLLRDFGIRTYREPPEVGLVTARKKIGAANWSIVRSSIQQ